MDGRILVLADDLTGAVEAGAMFAAQGIRTLVSTELSLPPDGCEESTSVLVIDTETRHKPAADAARRVGELARSARQHGFWNIYKKTDSTLRGNVASELGALAEAFPGSALLFVPAYPDMGRTVRQGVLYVDGVPVGETEFAHDGLNPVQTSSIVDLLANGPLPVVSIAPGELGCARQPGVWVFDSETDHDLQVAAEAFSRSASLHLAAGPAGFLHFLAPLVDLPRAPLARLPLTRTALVVNGSLHGISRAQVGYAKAHGFPTLEARHMEAFPPERGWVILECDEGMATGLPEADRLAQEIVQKALAARFDALVIFGGDTAYALLRALGPDARCAKEPPSGHRTPPIFPLGDVLEGVPISRISARHLQATFGERREDLYVITKAGGFGPRNVLLSLKEILSRSL